MKSRCLNIDWLECFCIETRALEPSLFENDGWNVSVRDYGTRVYHQMFTLYQYGTEEPLIEIRRLPKSAGSSTGRDVLPDGCCHIRLHNRTCYFANAAQLMADFFARYDIMFMSIFRIDLCLDFERFDNGDNPQKFITRVLKKKLRKINQGRISNRGSDMWDNYDWNSVSWGAKDSPVSTKLYNKTLELKEVKDKPYIRQAWAAAGLVDDFITLQKTKMVRNKKTGEKESVTYTPTIWRLEFSIRSKVKKWLSVKQESNSKNKYISMRNTLDCYYTKEQQLHMFASLATHYFHFKQATHNKSGEPQRKDRCPDYALFDFSQYNEFYKVEHVATAKPKNKAIDTLLKRLYQYRETQIDSNILTACDTIIEQLTRRQVLDAVSDHYNHTELTLLRLLVARRINEHKEETETVEESKQAVQALFTIEQDLFGEHV